MSLKVVDIYNNPISHYEPTARGLRAADVYSEKYDSRRLSAYAKIAGLTNDMYRVITVLDEEPMTFSEIRQATGMTSVLLGDIIRALRSGKYIREV